VAIIAVDFDGTCVEHEYPLIGKTVPGVIANLRLLIKKGHQIILFTMRDSYYLDDAIAWFEENLIPLWGVNENPEQTWTTSRKVYADFYIDDAAIGIPLFYPGNGSRPYVNWPETIAILEDRLSHFS
jgi:hydroxymethylpyrimidine pyrophosphatase-like HAD family hydrolase